MAAKKAKTESSAEVLARMGTDGAAWAKEFGAGFKGRVIDFDASDDDDKSLGGGIATGWFANAIEAGRAAGEAKNREAEAAAQAVLDDLGYSNGGPSDETAIGKMGLALRGLHDDREKLTAEVKTLQLEAATLRDGVDAAGLAEKERADKAEARVAELEKAAAAHATEKAKWAKAKPIAEKVRKLGPIKDGDLPADRTERTAWLRELIADADDVEIAFSDGRSEVKGLAPYAVSGEVWRDHGLGLMLTEPVDLHGPAQGQSAYAIAGYSLLIDGKPVAFTPIDPLSVPAGGHVQLRDTVYF